MHVARRIVRERTSMLRTLAALAVMCGVGAESADAKSSGITVSTTASVSGSVVQGTVVIANPTTQSMVIAALNDALEVRYATGSPAPPLPPGSSSGYYVVATLSLPSPGAVPARGSVSVPFSVNTCVTSVARYAGSKDMRNIATAVVAAQTAAGRSGNFAPPSQLSCPVCGNGRVESGEQCDGGPCCSSTCVSRANGTACSDANPCTRTDQCQGGVCVGLNPVTCAASDQCHATGTCNSATGTCSNPPAANGAPCNDGDACSTADRCVNGRCVGSPLSCDDGNVCTRDACAGGTCVHTDTNGPCDDGRFCTADDTCVAGACVSGPPTDCTDYKVCTTDSCTEPIGCASVPAQTCDGCAADECAVCQDQCSADHVQCSDACWQRFFSCLSGCTSTYCAPFCQFDLGNCLAACPDEPVCRSGCESGNGCDVGCSQPQ